MKTLFSFFVYFTISGLLLIGCGGSQEEEPELSGSFGNGKGGTAVNTSTLNTFNLTKTSNETIGSLQYDRSYFVSQESANGTLTITDNQTLTMMAARFSGRADTACRFLAAQLARDEDYDIIADGERTNANRLEFYQVNLTRGSNLHQRYYCSKIKDNAGTLIAAKSTSAGTLDSLQVHYVLNSVKKK